MKIDKNYKDYLYFLIGESLIKNFSDEVLINNFCNLQEIYNFRNNNDLLIENNEILLEILPAIAAGGARAVSALGSAGAQAAKVGAKVGSQALKVGSKIGSQAVKIGSKIANGAKNAVLTALKVGKNSVDNIGKMSKNAVNNMKNIFKNVSNVIKQKGKAELTKLLNNKIPEMLKNSKPFIDDAVKQIADVDTQDFLNRFKSVSSKDALSDLVKNSNDQNLVVLKELFKEKIYEICGALGIEFNKSNDIDKKDNQEKLLGIISGGVIDVENVDPVIIQRLVACIAFVSNLNDDIKNSSNANKDEALENAEESAEENVKDSYLSRVFNNAAAKGS